jgi:hypothetical protein
VRANRPLRAGDIQAIAYHHGPVSPVRL